MKLIMCCDVQRARHVSDAPGGYVSACFETHDGQRNRHLRQGVAYSSRSELGIAPEDHLVLLTNVALNSKNNREHMTRVVFEAFNVPAMLVTLQVAMSLATVTLSSQSCRRGRFAVDAIHRRSPVAVRGHWS